MTEVLDALRDALRHKDNKLLNVWRLNDGRYQINASPDGTSWTVVHATDPLDGILRAITGKPNVFFEHPNIPAQTTKPVPQVDPARRVRLKPAITVPVRTRTR